MRKSSFISTIIPAYNPRPFGYFFIIFPGSNMSAISLIQPDRDLFSWPQYWAACFGPAPFLP
ncbi:hypothetical protein OFN50_38605, partial [Escherichia coli]|nr:hypothetical protein [Escherichia coli]